MNDYRNRIRERMEESGYRESYEEGYKDAWAYLEAGRSVDPWEITEGMSEVERAYWNGWNAAVQEWAQ